MYQVGYTKLYFRAGQIGALEGMRIHFLQGTLEVQKCFRARRHFNELRGGVIALQSIIRGEFGRRHYNTLQKLKERDAHDKLDQQLRAVVQIQSGIRGWLAHNYLGRLHSSRIKEQKLKEQDDHNKLVQHISAVVQIQSSIRGWLARNHFGRLQSSKNLEQKLKKQDARNKLNQQLRAAVQIQSGIRGCLARNQLGRLQSSRKLVHNMHRVVREISEVEDLPKEVLASIIEELHRRVGSAENKLSQKEKENTALREKVQQLKAHRSEYKAKIKSMEGKWKKEKEALKVGKADCCSLLACGKPGGTSKKHANKGLSPVAVQETNGDPPMNIDQLLCEFKKNKETLDEKAKSAIDFTSDQPKSADPAQEYQQLRHQFESFSKDFKVQLKQLKAKVYKLRHTEGERRSYQKWWGKSIKK